MSELAMLIDERERVHRCITNLYWTYTRTARGKPPCVVAPELYAQRRALDERITELRRKERT